MAATTLVRNELRLTPSVISTNAELRCLSAEWKELFHRTGCDNVFLSFEWLSEWWFHLGQEHQLFVIAVRDAEGRLAALAPMYISLQAGPLKIRRLGFLGDKFVGSDHLNFIVDDLCRPAALECIHRFLLSCRAHWDFIDFSDSRADSLTLTAFMEEMQNSGMTVRRSRSCLCPYMRLPESPEAYSAGLRPKLRKNLKYYARTLQREGTVEFVTVEHRSEIESAFDELLRLHKARFAQRDHRSAFLNPKVAAFHRAALKSLSESGRVRIHFVQFQGRRIAALYGFSTGKKFFYYQSGLDPAFSRFSVGILLIDFAIQGAIRTNHTEFDFLRGSEPYKQLWASGTRELYNTKLFDQRGKSRLAQSELLIHDCLRACRSALHNGMTRLSAARAEGTGT